MQKDKMKEKLESYKKKTGKTWKQIAEEVCVTARQLRYIRSGKSKPSKAVEKLIKAL
jgi:transcriptional regulator with XRE-family HTH domain